MIVDSLHNAERYYALLPAMRRIVEYMASTDIAQLEEGSYPIDGDLLYVNVANAELRAEDEARLEVHNRYIDVQVVMDGVEGYGWRERRECADADGEFDTERDILFYRDAPQSIYRLHKGQFTILFPEDAHAPLIGKGRVRKLIFKVKI